MLIDGMYVAGFIVRFLNPEDGKPLIYGLFATEENANQWTAHCNTTDVVVEPVYVPTFNRG